jgi:hypothetical protein
LEEKLEATIKCRATKEMVHARSSDRLFVAIGK